LFLLSARRHSYPFPYPFCSQGNAECSEVTTALDFNLDSYISSPWFVHQQAVNTYLPEERFFCVRAQYKERTHPTFPWGYTIDVFNEARDAVDGTLYGGKLNAYVKEEPSKLAVAPSFIPKFASGDYWVIAYDEEKGYALISGGQPTIESDDGGCRTGQGINESGLWIFTRTQARDETLVQEARAIAADQGFDLSVLKNVTQDGCVYDDRRLTQNGLRGSI
jgi:lipocalin